MFGRGVRLTALGGLASAAFVHTSNNNNSNSNNSNSSLFNSFNNVQPQQQLYTDNAGTGGGNQQRLPGPESFSFLPAAAQQDQPPPPNSSSSSSSEHCYEPLDIEVVRPNEQGRAQLQQEKLKLAVNKARDLCWCKMYESGCPGMVVAISVDGKVVWQHGFGYADLENKLLAGTGCIMRIASISKSLTMAALGRLWEEGRLDLDQTVSHYLPGWPTKLVDNQPVDITLRQLCSHLGGIRHYEKKGEEKKTKSEFQLAEYHLKDNFKTTEDALKLFQDDELFSVPGTEFLYSTHGFTVLAAIIEKVTGVPFDKYMTEQFVELGLKNTYLDQHSPLIYNRSKYYVRDSSHRLRNAPYVDNSYKWAGGGFLSNVQDLVKFGNAMLFSYQRKTDKQQPAKSSGQKEKADDPASSSSGQTEAAAPVISAAATASAVDERPVGNGSQSQHVSHEVDQDEQLICDEVMEVEEVVFQPGPYSAINKAPPASVRLLPGYLKQETVKEMWRPAPNTKKGSGEACHEYGLGWSVKAREKSYAFCKDQSFYASHTGGAIGASSVLLIAPHAIQDDKKLPKGVVVAIICNLENVGLRKLATEIVQAFEGIETERPVKVQKVYQC